MGKQSFSTGGGGIIGMWPIYEKTTPAVTDPDTGAVITPATYVITIVPDGVESALPTNIADMFGKYGGYDPDATTQTNIILGLGIYTNKKEEVGIVSSTPAFDASPKTLTFVTDRDDLYSNRFLDRYCTSRREGQETPTVNGSTNEKTYQDGLAVRQAATEDTTIALSDSVFFAWWSAPIGGEDSSVTKNYRKVTFGLAGVAPSSPNTTYAYNADNQFTFTLTGNPQKDAELEIAAADLWTQNSVDFADMAANKIDGSHGGPQSFANVLTSWQDLLPAGYVFKLPKNTSILEDIIIPTKQ